MQDCSLYLGKVNLMQKNCITGIRKVVKSLGKNFNEIIVWANSHSSLVKILEGTLTVI